MTETATAINDAISYERTGAVVVVTIDHPPANAINGDVIAGIAAAWSRAEEDTSVGAVILTAAGPKFFAAGADITAFVGGGAEAILGTHELAARMERSRLPVIAAVNGIAFGGGCEIAMACDIRIAATVARFGQ